MFNSLPKINNLDRINTIDKCNSAEKELEYLLKQKVFELEFDKEKKIDYYEKKELVQSIRNIINDLSFENTKEYSKLLEILKEIQLDIKKQLELLQSSNTNNTSNNELVNMLIQRIISDTSKKTMDKKEIFEVIENDKELLEKYIIKVVKKQLKKEKNKTSKENQDLNIIKNNQNDKKLELLDLTIDKLNSMESLYSKIHTRNPQNKKKIISLVKEPAIQSIKPFINNENTHMANTIYIKE